MFKLTTLTVTLGERSYDIRIGQGLVSGDGAALKQQIPGTRAIIVTDTQVAPHFLAPLQDTLARQQIGSDAITLPAGEGTKTFSALESLLNQLLDRRPDRRTTLIALGGGVIGDITGFAASILLRGVPFIQIPTTLLAQVDSSVGGKTGINTAHGKNLIGSFYQPRLVLIDTDTLATLPAREMRAGYAEVLKYALINDPEFFSWLEANESNVLSCEKEVLTHAIYTSCRAKARIVAEDEREAGARALLNLGHTFAHALETEMGYTGALLHGEAVAMGMVQAFDLSARLGHCPPGDTERVRNHLTQAGLACSPRSLHKDWDPDALLRHMYQDKKASGGSLTFVLTRGIGKAFVAQDVPADKVRETLAVTC